MHIICSFFSNTNILIYLSHNNHSPNPTNKPTPAPFRLTSYPTTGSPTPRPNMDNEKAVDVLTGEECVIPGSNTCVVETGVYLDACDGNKPYCCNKDNGFGNGDGDKCTTKGGVNSCKPGLASPNTCSQLKPSKDANKNSKGAECAEGLFCCVQEQGNDKWGSCMTAEECPVGRDASSSSSSSDDRRRGLIRNARRRFLGSSDSGDSSNDSGDSSSSSDDQETCKKKKDLSWRRKDRTWKVGMKTLRDHKLPEGVPRVQNGVEYVGDQRVSMLVVEDGMLYEVSKHVLICVI